MRTKGGHDVAGETFQADVSAPHAPEQPVQLLQYEVNASTGNEEFVPALYPDAVQENSRPQAAAHSTETDVAHVVIPNAAAAAVAASATSDAVEAADAIPSAKRAESSLRLTPSSS